VVEALIRVYVYVFCVLLVHLCHLWSASGSIQEDTGWVGFIAAEPPGVELCHPSSSAGAGDVLHHPSKPPSSPTVRQERRRHPRRPGHPLLPVTRHPDGYVCLQENHTWHTPHMRAQQQAPSYTGAACASAQLFAPAANRHSGSVERVPRATRQLQYGTPTAPPAWGTDLTSRCSRGDTDFNSLAVMLPRLPLQVAPAPNMWDAQTEGGGHGSGGAEKKKVQASPRQAKVAGNSTRSAPRPSCNQEVRQHPAAPHSTLPRPQPAQVQAQAA
jgi:hypothetical protein